MRKILSILIIIITVALTAACTGVQMPPSLDQQMNYTPQIAENYEADLAWWRIYNDPQLNTLVENALLNNIDLAQAALDVNLALYQANLIGADLLPGFIGDINASTGKNIKHGGASTRSAGPELAVSYELDLWRKIADSVSVEEWEYQATIEDLMAARLSLVNNVVNTYFYLSYLNQAMLVTQDSLQNYKRIEQITQTKYKLGKIDALEQAQAMQSLLTAKNRLISLQTQSKEYEETLRNLLNLSPTQSLSSTSTSPSASPSTSTGLSYPDLLKISSPAVDLSVPLSVLANRPDLLAAENRVRSSFKNVQATTKSWIPSITLGAGISTSSSRVRTAFDVPILTGAVSISLPFLDWNRVKWNVEISEADFKKNVLSLQQSINIALNEVDKFYSHYLSAGDSLHTISSRYKYDVKISGYYQIRYDNGAAEMSDLLDSLNTETQSRLDLLNAKYNLLQYENALYRSLAGRYTSKEALII